MTNNQNNCPTCDTEIVLPAGTVESELITCEECETMLEVITTDGNLGIQEAPEVEEDWGE